MKHNTCTPHMLSTLLYNFICVRYLQGMSVRKMEMGKEIVGGKKNPKDDITTKKLQNVCDFREINSDRKYVVSYY